LPKFNSFSTESKKVNYFCLLCILTL